MRSMFRRAAPVVFCALLAACGKQQQTAQDSPLAFVPADAPYAYANLEPLPGAVTEQWSRPMQEYWPTMFGMYEGMLADSKNSMDDRTRGIVLALMEEVKTHGNWDKLREIGLKPDARVAFYGVGLVPVVRMELGNAAAFKAEVARVEQSAGAKLPVAKIDDQEYWQPGDETIKAAIAIQGNHLVITLLPAKASDALKRTLLGITRPAQNLGDAGMLQAIAKQYGYAGFGTGYFDVVRVVERLSKPLAGSDAEFAQTLGVPALTADAACQREYLEIAHKFPRMVAGAQELTPQRMRMAAQLEIDSGLAGQIAAALGAAPGSADTAQGAIDFSLAVPVLKLKDFWIAQADAVAAKPYECAMLKPLNELFAQSKSRIDVVVPPPLSDFTGVRASISTFSMPAGAKTPDVAGKLLLAFANPGTAMSMAQLMMPPLQKLKIAPDSKPVAVPADLLPANSPPLSVAMSDKGIAFATGTTEVASLPAYLAAPAASAPVFLRLHFGGAVYGWMARTFDAFKDSSPGPAQKNLETQAKMFGIYEKWLRSNDITLTATPSGIAMQQTIDLNAQ